MKTLLSLFLFGVTVFAQGQGNRSENDALAGLIVHERAGKVVVAAVLADSPAAKAGLKKGDTLLQAGERKLTRHNDLDRAIDGLEAGADVVVRYERGGKKQKATLKLVARRGFASDYLRGPGSKKVGFKSPGWSAFAWINVPKGKVAPDAENTRGKVVVFHCFQSW